MRQWIVTVVACTLATAGCGNDHAAPSMPSDAAIAPDAPTDAMPPASDVRARMCPTAQSVDKIPQRLDAVAPVATMTFADLRAAINATCAQCHRAPVTMGGFSYTDAYGGADTALGATGIASKMATALAAQTMPPDSVRQNDPAGFLKLGTRIQAWLAAGSPETGPFPLPSETVASGQQLPAAIAAAMTDIGDCVPLPEIIGQDAQLDSFFASATALPEHLADTDLVSLDAYELAQHGTVGYDVEYPLWADNAHKGRWVHVPAAPDQQGNLKPQAISFDATTGHFQIPDNTRFYKTFFKQVTESDGVVRYRKMETRLIVVRHAPRTPLFGTYLWDDNELGATLHTATYRDGTQFSDLTKTYVTDVAAQTTRTYAVPGRTRCNDCHQGSESDSFVLGFTPIQINRRALGDAGRQTPTDVDEMSQLTRLVSYGVVAGVTSDTVPRLETSHGSVQPRNIYELRFQAYATGNCAHCHNPKGYAYTQGIAQNFAPGGNIFQFSTSQAPTHGGNEPLIVAAGSPTTSLLYVRVSQKTHIEGSFPVPILQMPLHTPGTDCNLVTLAGQWITSIPKVTGSAPPTADAIAQALAAAAAFDSKCTPSPDINWLVEDFSDPPVYAPRRIDWQTAMPDSIRALQFTDRLKTVAETPVADGTWINLPDAQGKRCAFPTVTSPPGGTLPWMLDASGNPKFPYGELKYEEPGEYLFRTVCIKCHGDHADANSYLAKGLLYLTGGDTRVANLHDGLVGNGGANTSLFDVQENGVTRNLAGNYLIWMASGGTQAYFPPELGDLVGSEHGNMLYLVRNTICKGLLPNATGHATETNQPFAVVSTACTFDNAIDPALHGFAADHVTPLNADAQNAWLDHAAQNAGWMIFDYIKNRLALNLWSPESCHDLFPSAP